MPKAHTITIIIITTITLLNSKDSGCPLLDFDEWAFPSFLRIPLALRAALVLTLLP